MSVEQSNLISSLQSMRDRMMRELPNKYGDGFDGDMDTLLETINHLKRTRANVAHATATKAAEIERLQSAYEAMTRQAKHHMDKQDEAEAMLAKAVKSGEIMARKLDACEARAKRLAEALRPLANLDLRPDGFDKRPDDQQIYARDRTAITVGDVRRAQAALLRDQEEGK